MKSFSAAIIVIAGLQTAVTSALFVTHSDTQTFVIILGSVVAVIGLGGWIWSMRNAH